MKDRAVGLKVCFDSRDCEVHDITVVAQAVEFAEKLLKAEKVAVVPGEAFGPGGTGFVRCCYATGADELHEALRRMGRFMQSL